MTCARICLGGASKESVQDYRLSCLGLLKQPMAYVDGLDYYEYETDNPVSATDPTGLTSYITISGIHGKLSKSPEPTSDYMRTFHPQGTHTDVADLGSTVSISTILAHWNNVRKHLDSEGQLQVPGLLSALSQYCPANRKYNIAVIFFEPRTNILPIKETSHYHFTYTVWFDHEDVVPNQGFFEPGNGLLGASYWQNNFGGIDVSFTDWLHHGTKAADGEQPTAHKHGFPFGQWLGPLVNFSEDAGKALDSADFGIIAHSQGTNITMEAISQLH